jgi:hypothetical protein
VTRLAAIALLLAGCAAGPSFLNPDPVHGGPCGNGDQACHMCASLYSPDPWPCPENADCGTAYGECPPSTPPNAFPMASVGRQGDAGTR